MSARKSIAVAAILGVVCLFFAGCSVLSPLSGGGTSDQGNARIVGTLLNPSGTPVVAGTVVLLPADFDPVRGSSATVRSVLTDSTGAFIFSQVPPGRYTVTGADNNGALRFMANGIAAAAEAAIPLTGVLSKPGAIRVTIQDSVNYATGYFYIPGTLVSVWLGDNNNTVLLGQVPAGTAGSVIYSERNATVSRTIRYNVAVDPGDTTLVAMPGWLRARTLILNTTSSGAGVSGTEYGFPVLVRLTGSNFNFSQAQTSGADVRFTKVNGAPLAYEIDQWDAVNAVAAIWVKVDTVFGDNSTQSIVMLWDNPAASGVSNDAGVFDTAAGFLGVWHLAGNCYDATFNRNNGTDFGTLDTTGIIGNCKKFNGADSMRIAGLLGTPASITLSAWARIDTSMPHGEDIVSLGDYVLLRVDDTTFSSSYGSFHSDTGWVNFGINAMLAGTGWRQLTFTFDAVNHRQIFYLDGNVVKTGSDPHPINYSGLGINTLIGVHGNGRPDNNFYGAIDEVQVSKIARSADWIKLSFMNQKADDALLTFGK